MFPARTQYKIIYFYAVKHGGLIWFITPALIHENPHQLIYHHSR